MVMILTGLDHGNLTDSDSAPEVCVLVSECSIESELPGLAATEAQFAAAS